MLVNFLLTMLDRRGRLYFISLTQNKAVTRLENFVGKSTILTVNDEHYTAPIRPSARPKAIVVVVVRDFLNIVISLSNCNEPCQCVRSSY